MSFLFRFTPYILVPILSEWLELADYAQIDTSVSAGDRDRLNEVFRSFSALFFRSYKDFDSKLTVGLMRWLSGRSFHLERVRLCPSFFTALLSDEDEALAVEYFKTLRRVTLYPYFGVAQIVSSRLLLYCVHLEEVTIVVDKLHGVLDAVVTAIVDASHGSLKSITLRGHISEQHLPTIQRMCHNCPALNELSIHVDYQPFLRGGDFGEAAYPHTMHLSKLALSGSRLIDDIGLRAVLKHQSLVEFTGELSFESMADLAASSGRTLTRLELPSYSARNHLNVDTFPLFTALTHLNMSFLSIRGVADWIHCFPLLRSFQAHHCYGFKAADMDALITHCRYIEELAVYHCFESIGPAYPNLRVARFNTASLAEFQVFSQHCRKVEVLDFKHHGSKMDGMLECLTRLSCLTLLHFDYEWFMTDMDMVGLVQSFPLLQALRLNLTRCNGSGLVTIMENCPRLVDLKLFKVGTVTAAYWQRFCGLVGRLTSLGLHASEKYTQVTGGGLNKDHVCELVRRGRRLQFLQVFVQTLNIPSAKAFTEKLRTINPDVEVLM